MLNCLIISIIQIKLAYSFTKIKYMHIVWLFAIVGESGVSSTCGEFPTCDFVFKRMCWEKNDSQIV